MYNIFMSTKNDATEMTEEEKKKKRREEDIQWAISLVLAIIIAFAIRAFVFTFVVVEQSSMYPTLKSEEHVALSRVAYTFSKPRYGDIIVFESVTDEGKSLVKRVIAVGGQTIEIKNNVVYVDGKALDESSYIGENVVTSDYPLTYIPEGYVFVMGDNRGVSLDSRSFGPINTDNIQGRVTFRLSPFTTFDEEND